MRVFITFSLIVVHSLLFAQGNPYANISSLQFIFQVKINEEPLAFVSNDYYVQLNTRTGEFNMEVPISSLYYSKITPLYKASKDFDEECFHIEGNIPINRVLNDGEIIHETPMTAEIEFDGNRFETDFTLKIINRFPDGYIIQGESEFPRSKFNKNESEKPQDALLQFNFYAN